MVRAFLSDCGMCTGQIDRVAYLVGHHHTLSGIDGIDYQILIEKEATAQKEEPKKDVPKDRDYFNSIESGNDSQGNDPWKSFFGLMGNNGGYSSDPIVELASALFAGLMALAIQIDGMGEIQEVQQAPTVSPAESHANALASKNFDEAMNAMNNNPIKRTRS